MKQRTLGRTGLRVSEIGFGGWAIGGNAFGNSYGPTDDDESRQALRRALELGVTLIDTADIYGHGHSEALIGEVLQTWSGSQPIVVTKGGINFYRSDGTLEQDWTPYGVAHAVQQSLYRLRREAHDVWLLMNSPVEEMEKDRLWNTLEALKRAGKVRFTGVSLAEPADGVRLLQSDAPVDVIEVAYSIFDQSAAVELLPLAAKRRVGVLLREPLANGFLAGTSALRSFDDGDIRGALPAEYRLAMEETASQLAFLAGDGRSPAQAAIRFALDCKPASVIVGAKTEAQVAENVGAASLPHLQPDQIESIRKVFGL